MNQNDVAKEISKMDGGKINLNISEIKRVMACYNVLLFREPTLIANAIKNGEKNRLKYLPKLPKILKKKKS